jgi:hypothetical protein
MSMPHPRTMMIPFGAVILVSKKPKHTQVDIYTDKTQIEGLHPALIGLGLKITKNDDLPSTSIVANSGPAAVIAKRTVVVHRHQRAFMVKKSTKAAKKKRVPAADFQKPMKAGWYYWLEPK